MGSLSLLWNLFQLKQNEHKTREQLEEIREKNRAGEREKGLMEVGRSA